MLSKASYEGAFQTNMVRIAAGARVEGPHPAPLGPTVGDRKGKTEEEKKGQDAAASIGTSAKEGKEKTRPQYPLKEEKSDGDEVGGVIYEHKRCA